MFAISTKRVANEENYLLFENKKSDVMQLKKKLNYLDNFTKLANTKKHFKSGM